ncbi:MAG: MmcQ-like protein [Flavobacteriaceae bacterium]|nr:MmcQ-like protein [Flavobacteriaceae bacterium]
MDIETFRAYCLSRKGVTESFPFDAHTLVFKVMGKMFALCALEKVPVFVNLKCDPDWALQLREAHDGRIYGAYHMSKTMWNSVEITQLPNDLVLRLVDHSYELVVKGLTKKLRTELEGL